MLLFSYNFSCFEFPLYQSLGPDRSKEKMLKTISLAMLFTMATYLVVGVAAIALFGPDLSSNIMLDIQHIGPISFTMRVIFLVVIICHIPFTFLCTKEAACITADELVNQTISKHLTAHSKDGDCQSIEASIIQNMDGRVYYGVTVAAFVICVAFAVSVDNLLTLFDYLSALTVSVVQFLIPGLAYAILARGHPR